MRIKGLVEGSLCDSSPLSSEAAGYSPQFTVDCLLQESNALTLCFIYVNASVQFLKISLEVMPETILVTIQIYKEDRTKCSKMKMEIQCGRCYSRPVAHSCHLYPYLPDPQGVVYNRGAHCTPPTQ